jgi:ferredoxin
VKLTVNAKKCPQNHRCPAIAVCPKQAISQRNVFSLPVIDESKCIVCGKCLRYCPMGAFEMKDEGAAQ